VLIRVEGKANLKDLIITKLTAATDCLHSIGYTATAIEKNNLKIIGYWTLNPAIDNRCCV